MINLHTALALASIEQLLEAERIAIKYSPNAVGSIAKAYYERVKE